MCTQSIIIRLFSFCDEIQCFVLVLAAKYFREKIKNHFAALYY